MEEVKVYNETETDEDLNQLHVQDSCVDGGAIQDFCVLVVMLVIDFLGGKK